MAKTQTCEWPATRKLRLLQCEGIDGECGWDAMARSDLGEQSCWDRSEDRSPVSPGPPLSRWPSGAQRRKAWMGWDESNEVRRDAVGAVCRKRRTEQARAVRVTPPE